MLQFQNSRTQSPLVYPPVYPTSCLVSNDVDESIASRCGHGSTLWFRLAKKSRVATNAPQHRGDPWNLVWLNLDAELGNHESSWISPWGFDLPRGVTWCDWHWLWGPNRGSSWASSWNIMPSFFFIFAGYLRSAFFQACPNSMAFCQWDITLGHAELILINSH